MNGNEQALLIAQCGALKWELQDLVARFEHADELLRTHFQTPAYVDSKALAVVSEALAVLAGEP